MGVGVGVGGSVGISVASGVASTISSAAGSGVGAAVGCMVTICSAAGACVAGGTRESQPIVPMSRIVINIQTEILVECFIQYLLKLGIVYHILPRR